MAKRSLFDTTENKKVNVALGQESYFEKPSYQFPKNTRIFPGEVYDDYDDVYRPVDSYGVGESRYDRGLTRLDQPYLQNIRADKQGPMVQFGSMLGQAVIGEVAGGMMEGVGYLFALREFNKLAEGADDEFGNALSNAGANLREWAREEMPINEFSYREGEFRPWDWSWWMKNAPSIASSISLMIPAAGVAGVVSKVGKAVTGLKMSKTGFAVIQAGVSRHMESMMEAKGTFDELKESALAQGLSEQEAITMAAKGAQKNYMLNWPMIMQDIPQYMFLNRALAGAISTKGKLSLGQAASNIFNVESYNLLKDAIGEGLEEGYQFMSNEYSKHFIERQLNPNLDVPFSQVAKKHLKSGEIWTNMFFGALGAIAMQGGRGLMDKVRGIEDESVAKIKSQAQLFSAISSEILEARTQNNPIKEKLAEDKLISTLAVNAAINNSIPHTEGLIDAIVNDEFTNENLGEFGLTEEEVAPFRGQDNKQRAKELKGKVKDIAEKYNQVMSDISNPKSVLGKGFKTAYKNRAPQYKNMSPDNYAKLLAGTIVQTRASREAIDGAISELEIRKQDLGRLIDDESEIGKSYAGLSAFAKMKLQLDLELEAEQIEADSFRSRYTEEVLNNMSDGAKKDALEQLKYYDEQLKTKKEVVEGLGGELTPEDKKILKGLNTEDIKAFKATSQQLSQLKADSHAYKAMEKRLANGYTATKEEIEKYYKDFEERNNDVNEQFGFRANDIVFIPSINKEGIVDSVEKGEDGKLIYKVIPGTFDSLNAFVPDNIAPISYEIDDLHTSEYNDTAANYEEFETVSNMVNPDSNFNNQYRLELKKKRNNRPIITLDDTISYIHLDKEAPSKVVVRDKELDEFVSKPGEEIDKLLQQSTITYSVDFNNKYWTDPADTPEMRQQKTDLFNRLTTIFNPKSTKKDRNRDIRAVLKFFYDTPTPQTSETGWNTLLDTIPISVTITSGDKKFNNELFVHDSDFWNLSAPEEEGVNPEIYKKTQREKTRAFRLMILDELMAGRSFVVNGLSREGGHLNRVATADAIHNRLEMNIKELELWVALDEDSMYAANDKVSTVSSIPGSVSFKTSKTMQGNTVSIMANVANLTPEHADILLNTIVTLNAPGKGRRSPIYVDNTTIDNRVEGITAGEVIGLLALYGTVTTDERKLSNHRLFIDENRRTLYFGTAGKIEDILNISKAERSAFITWAIENKKYRIPLKLKRLPGYSLNKPINKKFKIGSIVNDPTAGLTWAQVLASTQIKHDKRGKPGYIVSTNVTLNSNKVVDGKPVLIANIHNITEANESAKTEEPIVTPPVTTPTEEGKIREERAWMDDAINVLTQYVDKSYGEWGKTMAYPDSATVLDLLEKSKNIPEDIRIKLSQEGIAIRQGVIKPVKRSRLKNAPSIDKNNLPAWEYDKVHETGPRVSKTEKNWFSARFPGKTIEEVDKLLQLAIPGREAFGLFRANAIYIYKESPMGVIYHEAFHRVSLGYLSKKERAKYYDEARKKYNMPNAKDSVVEERLANEFRAWKLNQADEQPLYAEVTPWIKRLYDFIVYFFTGSNRLNSYEIEGLFKQIDAGRFTDRFIGLKRRYDLKDYEAPYEVASLLGTGRIDMPEINSHEEFMNFVKGLTTILIAQSNVVSLKQYKNINLKNLFNYIEKELLDKEAQDESESDGFRVIQKSLQYDIENNILQEGETLADLQVEKDKIDSIVKLYESVLDPKYMPVYVKHIHGMLRSQYGIAARDNVFENEEDLEFSVEEASSADMILRYGKASYEVDVRDNASSNIKFLIATIRENEDINEITRVPSYVSFDHMWYDIMFGLHDKLTIEEMMDYIKKKGEVHYSYMDLYNKLSNAPERLRTQFKVTVNKHKHEFVNILYNRTRNGGFEFEIKRADVSRAEKDEARRWAYDFFESEYFKEHNGRQIVNVKKYNELLQKWEDLKNKVKEELPENKTTSKRFNKTILANLENDFLSFISEFSIGTTKEILDYVLENRVKEFGSTYASELADYILKKGGELVTRFADIREKQLNQEGYNVYGGILSMYESPKKLSSKVQSVYIVRELSEAKYNLYPDLLNIMVIGPDGHQYFAYSDNSYATDQIKKFRDEKEVDRYLGKQYHKYSYLLNSLKNNESNKKNIGLKTLSAWQERDASDKGTSYANLNDIEDYVMRLTAFQAGLIPLPILADRTTYYFLDGFKMPQFLYNIVDNQLVLQDEVIDIFINYARAEKDRIDEANELLKRYEEADDATKKNILENEMIQNYHYNIVKEGDSFKPIFKPKGNLDKWANAYKYIEFRSFNAEDFNFEAEAKGLITTMLEEIVEIGIDHALKNNVIRLTEENTLENNYLDKGKLLETQKLLGEEEDPGPIDFAIRNTIMMNELSMLMTNFETNMLFVGDPAFYASKEGTVQADRIKRLGVMTSSGSSYSSNPITYGNNQDYFNLAVLHTQKINMNDPDQFDKESYANLERIITINYATILLRDLKFRDPERYKQYETVLDEDKLDPNILQDILKKEFKINIKDLLRPYRDIDPTDGQGYITPQMYRSLLDKHGEWTDEMEEAYNLMLSKPIGEMTPSESVIISRLLMPPLKPVLFDLLEYDQILSPLYLKLSTAVLWPGLIQGTHLQEVYDRMMVTGKYEGSNKQPVHMVVYNSAVKVGNRASKPLYKKADRKEVNDLFDLASYPTPFASLRKQIVTDPHDVEESKMGTQFAKIGLADLNLFDKVYNFNGNMLTGREISNVIFKSLAGISDKGLLRLKEKIGWKDENKSIDLKTLSDTLREDAIMSAMPDLISDSFRLDSDGSLYIELDAMPNKRQISSRIIGMTNKSVIDILMPGNAFIQMSNQGLAASPSEELKWYTIDAEGRLTASEAIVSISMFKHVIPNYEDISFEDARKWVLENTPEILAYRIPTQSQASVIYLKIKDVTEESMGDTIILPSPVTALTGSDFDIDKLYAIRYNYSLNEKGNMSITRFGNTPEEAFNYQTVNIINNIVNKIDKLGRIYKIDPDKFRGNKVDTLKSIIQSLGDNLYEDLLNIIGTDLDYLMKNVETDSSSLSLETIGVLMHIKDTVKDWNLKEIREKFLEDNKNKDPYEYNTVGAIKNQLFTAYLSIYSSKEHLIQTQLPLGGFTGQLKKLASTINEEFSSNDLYVYSATHQNKLKFQYNGGQKGIAPFALNNVHHILGQIARLQHTGNGLGLLIEGDKGGISLNDTYGKDRLSILSWLSAMIDAHVDLAKDNYIMKLNVNEVTYNVTSLLLRGGMGIETFKFLSQPILKEFARSSINSGRKHRMRLYYNETHAFNETKKQWEAALSEDGKKEYENIKGSEFLNNESVEETISIAGNEKLDYYNKTIESFESDKEKDAFILHQLRILSIYKHFDYISKDLNNLVQLSQIDTKKYGKTAVEVIHYNKRLEDFTKKNEGNYPLFKNADKLLPIKDIKNGESLLGPYYRNSVGFLLDVLPQLTIYASPVFMRALGTILDLSNNSDTLDKRFINSIADELYATIVGEFFHDDIITTDTNKDGSGNLVVLWNSVMEYLGKIQMNKVPEAAYLKNNAVMRSFSKLPITTEAKLPIKYFIGTAKKSFADKLSNDDYMYDWLDMLNADQSTEEGKRIVSFAKRLFVFAFYNSGFRNRLHSFFNIIPPDLIKDFQVRRGEEPVSLNEFIKGKRQLYSDPILSTEIMSTIDEVFINNAQNKDLIPTVFDDNIPLLFKEVPAGKLKEDNSVPLLTAEDGSLTMIELNHVEMVTYDVKSKKAPRITKDSNHFLGNNMAGDPIFTKYIMYYDNSSAFNIKPHLFKYIGYYKISKEEAVDAVDSNGRNVTKTKYITEIHPIYKTIPRKSYDKGGITYKEYWFDQSAIEENQETLKLEYLDKNGKEAVKTINNYIPDGDEMLYFNHPSMEFENAKDVILIDDYSVVLDNAFAGNISVRDRLISEMSTDVTEDTNISTRTVEQPEDMSLNQLKDLVNNKYKDKPNYVPLTLKDMIAMSPEEITNHKNCL